MNLLISIFGGMLLTALLYWGARFIKLSNFWSAVAAAGLPVFAYLIYAVSRWPGLDVVTLHLVTYPTISVLLFQMYEKKPGSDPGVHWVPKLLIAFFVVITIVLGGFVYIAGHGLPPALAQWLLPNAKGKTLHTGFAGVLEHGEEAAKSIAHRRNIDARLAKMGWKVDVTGLNDLAPGRPGEVRVQLHQSDGRGVVGQQLMLALIRPGDPAGNGLVMQEVEPGDYRVSLALPAGGAWLAQLSLIADGKRITLEHAVGHE